jgi:hypothetical protein
MKKPNWVSCSCCGKTVDAIKEGKYVSTAPFINSFFCGVCLNRLEAV